MLQLDMQNVGSEKWQICIALVCHQVWSEKQRSMPAQRRDCHATTLCT